VKLHCLGTDRRALAELLQVVCDDQRAAGKTAFDYPAVAVLRAKGYVIYVNRVIRADRVNLLWTLEFGNRYLRN
jgi:hypothetical protein